VLTLGAGRLVAEPQFSAWPGGAARLVHAKNGMVATEEALATRVGVGVLRNGGNAVDAAVVGDEITAQVEIVRIRAEKQIVNLSTRCLDSSGAAICQGEALIMVSDVF